MDATITRTFTLTGLLLPTATPTPWPYNAVLGVYVYATAAPENAATAIALAVASAGRGQPLSGRDGRPLACFGELGLTGDLRYVAHADRRVREAVKFGLEPVIGPRAGGAIAGLSGSGTVREALRAAFSDSSTTAVTEAA